MLHIGNSLRAIPKVASRRPLLYKPQRVVFLRLYSSDIEDKTKKLLATISSNEKLKATFEEFGKLVASKGFNADMGVMQQMKFLLDGDVRNGLKKVGDELKESGIEFKPEDIQAFTQLLNIKK